MALSLSSNFTIPLANPCTVTWMYYTLSKLYEFELSMTTNTTIPLLIITATTATLPVLEKVKLTVLFFHGKSSEVGASG